MSHPRVFALSTLTLAVVLGACAFVGAAPEPPSPSSREDAEAAVLRLLDDWAAAYVKHDRAAIDRILGEEFVMSTARRELQTRAEYLVKVEKDQEPHASITRDDERVRIYGDVAVVNHRLTRTTRGQSYIFRITDVCVRRDGRWQLVNRHITELPQAP
jgi:hypothetical protein